MHTQYRIIFDPSKIIDHFGGIAGAVAALALVKMTVKPKTLQKQRERGNMPSDMVASLVLASAKIGNPINLFQCLLEREDN